MMAEYEAFGEKVLYGKKKTRGYSVNRMDWAGWKCSQALEKSRCKVQPSATNSGIAGPNELTCPIRPVQ